MATKFFGALSVRKTDDRENPLAFSVGGGLTSEPSRESLEELRDYLTKALAPLTFGDAEPGTIFTSVAGTPGRQYIKTEEGSAVCLENGVVLYDLFQGVIIEEVK